MNQLNTSPDSERLEELYRYIRYRCDVIVSDIIIESIKEAVAAARLDEQRMATVCACELSEPCIYACSCAAPHMSGGCMLCASYGSMEQKQAAAKKIAARFKATVSTSEEQE